MGLIRKAYRIKSNQAATICFLIYFNPYFLPIFYYFGAKSTKKPQNPINQL